MTNQITEKMANISTPGGFSTPHNTLAGSVSPTKAKGLGAEFFPVASGVQVPYVGEDVRNELVLKVPYFERPTTLYTEEYVPSRLAVAHTSLVSTTVPQHVQLTLGKRRIRPDSPEDGQSDKLLQVLSQHPHAGSDKSSKEVSKRYLKTISSGFTFSDDVLHSRAPHTIPYRDSNDLYTAGNVVHAKAKTIGPVGRHDPRGEVRKHMPCHLKGPRKLKPLKQGHSVPSDEKRVSRALSLVDFTSLARGQGHSELPLSKEVSHHEWDEHCLGSLSKSTAEWIVREHLTGSEKDRLGGFLKKRYKPLEENIDAVKGDKSETQTESTSKSISNSKERVKDKHSQTAELHYTPSFTLPSHVGDKKLDTQNVYQLELLGGAQPMPSKKLSHCDNNIIVLDSNDKIKFQKNLQDNFPQGAKPWFPGKAKHKKESRTGQINRQTKGLQRWKDLPTVVQDDIYMPAAKSSSHSDMDIAALSASYKLRSKIKEDFNVVKIAEDWRSKWFLERKWQNSSTQELIEGMTNINDHVRLAAVAACSKAAMIRKAKKEKPKLHGILLEKTKEPEIPLQETLEPEMLDTVTRLLHDNSRQVRIAAAITLYTLSKPSEEAESVLLWALENGGAPEKWAATQCLAMSGTVSDQVINELVSQLHSDNSVRTVEAGALLAELSQYSGIVQALIAELLNSNSWKDRATACKVIPKLKGGINKDMTLKLSYLMWNDWSKGVRTAAAQALGKTGNGKLVHDTLRERIMNGNERIKVDALKKLSNLGIMTLRLLPALLECFRSEYVSVRIEAAMAAGQLRITDDKMMSELVDMTSNDRSWKVKAHAIKALGCVGIVNDEVTNVLLWAIRYERVAAVRAEACNAVASLLIKDERILGVLQDRLVVESDDLVKREAIFTLQTLGVEPTGDLEMIEAIRKEVRRLCTRDTVVAHILDEDNSQAFSADYKRLFTTSQDEEHISDREKTTASRTASQASQRGWDPILAGYQAREIMSRVPTPGGLHMEHSYLPMDLNSASSENSSAIGLDDEEEELDEGKLQNENYENSDRLSKSPEEKVRTESAQQHSTQTKTVADARGAATNKQKCESGTPNKVTDQSRPHSLKSADSSTEHAQDLCSEPESSNDEPELMKLADDASEQHTVSFEPSETDD